MSSYLHIESGQYPLAPADIMLANPHMSFPVPFEAPDGYVAVVETPQPTYSQNTQRVEEAPPVEQDGAWVQQWAVVALTSAEKNDALATEKARLFDASTNKRWAVETSGITLAGGLRIDTAREDQDAITRILANAPSAGITEVSFKAASGWVTMSLGQLQQVANAVALHVQACYTAERAHHEAIEKLTLAKCRTYDVMQGWPENVPQ